MKILYVVNTFPVYSETFIINQITGIISLGHEVTIYSLNKPVTQVTHHNIKRYNLLQRTIYKPRLSECRIKKIITAFKIIFNNKRGFKIILQLLNPFIYGRNALNLSLLYLAAPFLDKTYKYNIIHAHFGEIGNLIHCLIKHKVISGKQICSFHGIDVNKYVFREDLNFYQNLFNSLDIALVNSNFLKKRLMLLGGKSDKIIIHPNPVDTLFFKKREKKIKDEIVQIISVGRISEEKGFDIAIKVIINILEKGYKKIHLQIIGSGKETNKLYNLITNNNLQKYVNITPFLSQELLVEKYNRSDIFLLCSRRTHDSEETQGIVIQEAQSMQLPVVVSDIGGVNEGLINNMTGFLCNENNIECFSNKLIQLITNKDLREKMGKKARDFIKSNYDYVIMNKKLENIYKLVSNA